MLLFYFFIKKKKVVKKGKEKKRKGKIIGNIKVGCGRHRNPQKKNSKNSSHIHRPFRCFFVFLERENSPKTKCERRERDRQTPLASTFLPICLLLLPSPPPPPPQPQTLTLFPGSLPTHHLPGTSLLFYLFSFYSKDLTFFCLSFHCFPLISRSIRYLFQFCFLPLSSLVCARIFQGLRLGIRFWVNFFVGCVFDL